MERHDQSADFERLSWHDNIVYGVRFDVGDSFRGDRHSHLVLDIDHIVEWICGVGGEIGFCASGYSQVLRAAPVELDEQRLAPADRA